MTIALQVLLLIVIILGIYSIYKTDQLRRMLQENYLSEIGLNKMNFERKIVSLNEEADQLFNIQRSKLAATDKRLEAAECDWENRLTDMNSKFIKEHEKWKKERKLFEKVTRDKIQKKRRGKRKR